MISLVPGVMLDILLNVLLMASHEKAFKYMTNIVIYAYVHFEVIIFISSFQSMTKLPGVTKVCQFVGQHENQQ